MTDRYNRNHEKLAYTAQKLRSGNEGRDFIEVESGEVLPSEDLVRARIDRFLSEITNPEHAFSGQLQRELEAAINALYGRPDEEISFGFGLEAVVIADGSRPVFHFEDGKLAGGAGTGPFVDYVNRNSILLEGAAKAVGRIESGVRPGRDGMPYYSGTGFLVGPDLLLTNRHVMQDFVREVRDAGPFTLDGPYYVNFMGEFNSQAKLRRRLAEVVWAGPTLISRQIHLDRYDAALIRLGDFEGEPAEIPTPLPVLLSELGEGEVVYAIGYPANPGNRSEIEDILIRLFDNRFGGKRCAPGEIDALPGSWHEDVNSWTVKHDASTLGGNSGSPLITLRNEVPSVLGLHIGGLEGSANYGHTLNEIRDLLGDHGATLV